MGGQWNAPCGWRADTGRGNRHANAAGAPNIVSKRGRGKGAAAYVITPSAGEPFTLCLDGRVQWALDRLRRAGLQGCTPIDDPGPRWSAYVHRLRRMGVAIETIYEPHGGPFAGTHGRYVLRSRVTPARHREAA